MDPNETTELNLEHLNLMFELIATADKTIAKIDEALLRPRDENGNITVNPVGMEGIKSMIVALKSVVTMQTEHDQQVLEAMQILLDGATPKQ